MAQPQGFIGPHRPSHVCRLWKATYGLKQAPHSWYNELNKKFTSYGFINSLSYTSLFIYHQSNAIKYLLVYVDDLVLTKSDSAVLSSFIKALAATFSLKDLANLGYFLGIEVTPSKHSLFLIKKNTFLIYCPKSECMMQKK